MMKRYLIIVLLSGALTIPASAYTTYYIPGTEMPSFQFNVYSKDEKIKIDGEYEESAFNIPQSYIKPLFLSAIDWCKQIGLTSSPVTPAIYSYMSEDEYNAAAGSPYVTVAEQPYKVTKVNAILHGWTITTPASELDGMDGDGIVFVGLGISEEYPGWENYTGKHALYHGLLPDMYTTMKHEIMHSLGVTTAAQQYREDFGDESYYFSQNSLDPLSNFDAQLRIYTGTTNPITDSANEIAPLPGQKIGEGVGEYDVINYSPYFVGENTIKVLGGDNDYATAKQNIVDNGGLVNYSDYYYDLGKPYPKVYGLPIHPSDDDYDLSHLELRNSYMSHQDFRNWLVPMEAELAMMNDLGYNIDLRKYFGKSYYLNNKTDTYTAGFSKWDGTAYTGAPSTIDQAVGIHIYGDNNTITQAVNDIKMMGQGSIGVRIDGKDNTYNLASGNINANGKENIGIAVTWGSGHNVNITGGTEVTATGKDGIAVSFDYGSNMFGTACSNSKGSYINHIANELFSIDVTVDPENSAPLVANFDVNGTLEGDKAAIYISNNAHVANININDGAQIKGNIISKWNSLVSGNASVQIYDTDINQWRKIQPTDKLYYTKLNFNGTGGITVDGDINGDNGVYNTLRMQNAAGSKINFNGTNLRVNSLRNNGDINISQTVNMSVTNRNIAGAGTINILNGAGLNMLNGISNIENNMNFDNASFNLANNTVNNVKINGLELSGKNTLGLDVDVASLTSDHLVFNNQNDLVVNAGAGFNINNVNLLNTNQAYTKKEYYVPFISSEYNNQKLLGNVSFTAEQNFLTPIFKYGLGYKEDAAQGGFLISRGPSKKYSSYNPAVVAAPVAAQFGGYLNQLNSYEQAFNNLDMRMLMTKEERQAYKMANLYASTDAPKVFSPTYLPEKNKGGWFRPYASFEKADLRNGPKVESITYGSYFGGDSPMFETKNGWDYQYSLYAGYNGSHQNYSGNSIYQNGGTFGGSAIWYKDNFFTALTANVGASVAEASTMYGSEDFTMLMSGVASKTGYNWELAKGKFIIQPSFLMSYTFVNTFDYTNAAGVRIKSDPLNAINIAPGLKFIGNLKNGWQPYVGMQMVWNIMDKTDFKASDAALPNMSIKPYFQYGVGVQKRWGERFTGFLQAMIRNGGRNGIALSFGFRWALGKSTK